MATIALRVPTTAPNETVPVGGSTYILFPEPNISVRDLIAEKVRAELRKARAWGGHDGRYNAVDRLLPEGATVTTASPLDEQLAIMQACRGFTEGLYLILCDGRPLVDLGEVITLTRRTGLVFLVGVAVGAAV